MAANDEGEVIEALRGKLGELSGGRLAPGLKGGVSISMDIGATRFCFVGAHLAAHQGEVEKRNRNAAAILSRGLPQASVDKGRAAATKRKVVVLLALVGLSEASLIAFGFAWTAGGTFLQAAYALAALSGAAMLGAVLVLATWWFTYFRRRRAKRRADGVAGASDRHPAVSSTDGHGAAIAGRVRSGDAVGDQ